MHTVCTLFEKMWVNRLNLMSILLQLACANSLQQPHILLMIADDLGYHDVGYHGADIFTPNIDKLANDGVILENYYVQPICTPSRSQLMTGRYQIHFGLQHSVLFAPQPHCLPLDETLLPAKLREAGYSTHIVGKWHLGFCKYECLPTSRGFDSFYGYLCGKQDYYTKEVSGFLAGWEYSEKFKGYDFHDNLKPAWEGNGTYSTYLYQQRALKVIQDHDKNKPLFLYLPFQSVHFPLQAPQKYIDMYPNIKDHNRKIYSAMVTAMDDVVGAVVNELQKQNMWNNTVTVFSTDNGGQTLQGGNNWPLRGRKASLWEGGVRGVGLVHGAGIVDKGRTSTELMHVSDWFPTLLHVANATTSGTKPLDSHNVWDAISSKNGHSPRTELLHNIDPIFKRPYGPTPPMTPYPNKYGVNTLWGHTALRWLNWKLYTGDPGYESIDPPPTMYRNQTVDTTCLVSGGYHPDCKEPIKAPEPVPSVRLYDITADPSENVDVAKYFPMIVDQMLEKIAAYNKTAVPVSWPGGDKNCDPALQDDVWGPWM